MKKSCILIMLFIACALSGNAQSAMQYRIVLIGDAGETNDAQQTIINDVIQRAVPGKTLVLYLGDNIYPRGLDPDPVKQAGSLAILRSQFEAFRKNNIPVYFVPGNHDWDDGGPKGYDKMLAVNSYINTLQDSLLQIIPSDMCPGPVEIPVNDHIVIVAMDTEWWLYQFDKHSSESDCPCKTKRDVLGVLNDIIARNSHKTIIFATHHPFVSYGAHGGYFSFKQHIFPLTDLRKKIYFPLPVLGSVYLLARKLFPFPEDLQNVLYKDMRISVNEILAKHPNIIHAAGHEHTLQLIEEKVLEVVSGAGCQQTPVKKGAGSLYAADSMGYAQADILNDNSLQLQFFTYNGKTMHQSYAFSRAYSQPMPVKAYMGTAVNGDSIKVKIATDFNQVSKAHRQLFGENYRQIWAAEASLPVFRITKAGLRPTELGGGMQTHSLKMKDKDDKEYVIRTIDKYPDAILPQALSQTLASKLVHDNVSAIYPYAPLTVATFSDAVGVPHSHPSIVYVAPDTGLGIYSRDFVNKVVLLEEREPLGKSSSTIKMQQKLKDDNDNSIDQRAFLKARTLDIFLADWDRHGDQWRWVDEEKGKGKKYRPVPRDRDQVFYTNQGLFPHLLALPWVMPKFEGLRGHIRNINNFSFNARLIDGLFTNALTASDWDSTTRETVAALPDTLIDAAMRRMPKGVYDPAHDKIAGMLKQRREDLLRVMPEYYRFLNRNVDITLSDKHEAVVIKDTLNDQLQLTVFKINKKGDTSKLIYQRVFDPAVTKELRLYTYGGEDRVSISNNGSPITVRLIGDGQSHKTYSFSGSRRYLKKVHVYENDSTGGYEGESAVHLHRSSDPSNFEMQVSNRYNKNIPLLEIGFNKDDGILAGAGLRWIRQGFRKQPYGSVQQLVFAHSFTTHAYRLAYKGEWIHAIGKADFTLSTTIWAPDNTQNFFGRGNATPFDKTGNYKHYYRARFDLYDFQPALRWRNAANSSFSIGPMLQFYHMNADDNVGRFIMNTDQIHSADSATLFRTKAHLGLAATYLYDGRNHALLPTGGAYVHFRLTGNLGLNKYSEAFSQLTGQIAFYKSIDRKSAFVLANRIGGGVSAGKTTFYQSMFLGGQDNLLGYRQHRFAGQHMAYNNLELRIRLANLASYLLPGQLGLVGFYDTGRVWEKGYNDAQWHQGIGGGLYFAPAQMILVQLVEGNSGEGWYPYFTMGFRF